MPRVFTSRWAMSYLRGPLTGPQIATLMADRKPAPAPAGPAVAPEAGSPAPQVAARPPTPVPPEELVPPVPAATPGREPGAADHTRRRRRAGLHGPSGAAARPGRGDPGRAEGRRGRPVRFLDPAATWAAQVGRQPGGTRLVAGLAARVVVRYDDTAVRLDHTEEYELVAVPLARDFDAAAAIAVDYDDRDLRSTPPAPASYVLPDAPVHTKTWFTSAAAALKRHLEDSRSVTVLRNTSLKIASRIGEDRAAFEARCREAAGNAADAEGEKLRERLERQSDRLHDVLERSELRLGELEVDVKQRQNEEWLSGAGGILGSLLGGRRACAASRGRCGARPSTARRPPAPPSAPRPRSRASRTPARSSPTWRPSWPTSSSTSTAAGTPPPSTSRSSR